MTYTLQDIDNARFILELTLKTHDLMLPRLDRLDLVKDDKGVYRLWILTANRWRKPAPGTDVTAYVGVTKNEVYQTITTITKAINDTLALTND